MLKRSRKCDQLLTSTFQNKAHTLEMLYSVQSIQIRYLIFVAVVRCAGKSGIGWGLFSAADEHTLDAVVSMQDGAWVHGDERTCRPVFILRNPSVC